MNSSSVRRWELNSFAISSSLKGARQAALHAVGSKFGFHFSVPIGPEVAAFGRVRFFLMRHYLRDARPAAIATGKRNPFKLTPASQATVEGVAGCYGNVAANVFMPGAPVSFQPTAFAALFMRRNICSSTAANAKHAKASNSVENSTDQATVRPPDARARNDRPNPFQRVSLRRGPPGGGIVSSAKEGSREIVIVEQSEVEARTKCRSTSVLQAATGKIQSAMHAIAPPNDANIPHSQTARLSCRRSTMTHALDRLCWIVRCARPC